MALCCRYLTAVRGNLMFEGQPRPGFSSYRPWLVAIVRPAAKPAMGSVHIFCVESDKATRPLGAFQDACFAPPDAAACLATLAAEVGSRPPAVQVMPMNLGRWTYTSACTLCDALATGGFPTVVVRDCLEIPDTVPGSARKLAFVGGGDLLWPMFMEVVCDMLEDFEEKLQPTVRSGVVQSKLTGLTGMDRGAAASKLDLRELFAAAAEFHAARPWESFAPVVALQVELQGGGGADAAAVVFVLVVGQTEYDGRGCWVFDSLDDLLQSQADMEEFVCNHANLSFFEPKMFPFRGAGTSQHGLSSKTMPLITSDCDATRSRASNGPNRLGLCALQTSTTQPSSTCPSPRCRLEWELESGGRATRQVWIASRCGMSTAGP